ncbi:MGMT family protein [Leptolyngbya sp. FACHB-541]|uniref:MOSC domain-containing protein n=1 Tax=Leptolyngbya sp. FACHB-541 TaxID=2692810 RepID=UPI001686D0B0|nr:MGMT family protein [Leptolyngbya sp. FACHB-541]
MKAVKLFAKQHKGAATTEREELLLKRGVGVEGDVYAIAGNPRQILLVDTPTLAEFDLNPGDLRENLLIDAPIESLASGQVLQVGQSALIRITFPCDPCSQLNQLKPGLATRIKGKRGLLGMVVRDGLIKAGEQVQISPYQFSPLPENAKGRFTEFVTRIQSGKVVSTAHLLMALGLARSYYRTIPIFLKKAGDRLPIHRIVAPDGGLITKHMPQQQQALEDEGIGVIEGRVSPDFFWEQAHFHDIGAF